MPSTFFLTTTTPSFISHHSKAINRNIQSHPRRTSFKTFAASSSSSSSWIAEFDLYELLGVESSSDQSEIKKAYRNLQKRCHPDVAGAAGHDMAIILNEVYSLLSDPNSRSAYDQEQAKLSAFRGYTGKPLYSTWFGSENEQRAIFVDEVKCVGCLKCALYANKTFAIESVYGRARAIAQWADPEDKILDAIQTCPVDCISIIERSNLAALEFLMSKQPRGNVRMTGGGNTGGTRVSNIFAEVNKFQRKFEEMKEKSSRKESKESNFQKESRISAVQGIRSISNWWYWKSPPHTQSESQTSLNLIHIPHKSPHPNTKKLQEAAAKLKSLENAKPTKNSSMSCRDNEEYWSPMLTLPSPSNSFNSMASQEPQPTVSLHNSEEDIKSDTFADGKWDVNSLRIPLAMAAISVAIVGSRGADMNGHILNEHIGGSGALEVVNSFEMQVVLAGITWFVIGMGIVGMFEMIGSKGGSKERRR